MKDNTYGDYSKEEEYGQAPNEPHDEQGRPVKERYIFSFKKRLVEKVELEKLNEKR